MEKVLYFISFHISYDLGYFSLLIKMFQLNAVQKKSTVIITQIELKKFISLCFVTVVLCEIMSVC